MTHTRPLPDADATQPIRAVDPEDSTPMAGDGHTVYPYHGQELPPGHRVYPPHGPNLGEQVQQLAGPIVSVRYHTGTGADGDPYERVEIDFNLAPPGQVLLAVLELLMTSTRETVITTEADGAAHIYGQRRKENQ